MLPALLTMTLCVPPPSTSARELLERAAAARPQYVLRVWTSRSCAACQSKFWKKQLGRFEQIDRCRLETLDFDKYPVWAAQHGVSQLPFVQLFQYRAGKKPAMIGQLAGQQEFSELIKLLPAEDRPAAGADEEDQQREPQEGDQARWRSTPVFVRAG